MTVKVYYEFPFTRKNGTINYLEAVLHVDGEIDNDSFDYAGTHCTHGQSGTCHLPDYFRADGDINIDSSHTKWERRIIRKMLKNRKHLEKIWEKAEERGMEQYQEDKDAWLDAKAEYEYENRRELMDF